MKMSKYTCSGWIMVRFELPSGQKTGGNCILLHNYSYIKMLPSVKIRCMFLFFVISLLNTRYVVIHSNIFCAQIIIQGRTLKAKANSIQQLPDGSNKSSPLYLKSSVCFLNLRFIFASTYQPDVYLAWRQISEKSETNKC